AFHRQLAGLHRSGPSGSQTRLGHPRGSAGKMHAGGHLQGSIFASRRSPASRSSVKTGPARSRTLKRRRDVLTALVATALATLVLGALPFLRGFWAVHVLVDVALIGYVALLLRLRNLSAVTDMNVRFLPFAVPLDPMIEPAMLRQSVR
ncbi:MAG: hypothetical protein ACRDRT_08905, partial [Pseudonocardiaceae bacterium]